MGVSTVGAGCFPETIVLFVCPACHYCLFTPLNRSLPPEPGQVPYCQKCAASQSWVQMLRCDYRKIPAQTILT
jgi:hypothetical protein